MSGERPNYVAFGEYSRHVPPSIPAAVQQATARFIGNRAARIAEMDQWEELRQAASDLRLHTLENLDAYLEQTEKAIIAAGGHVHWAPDGKAACDVVLEIVRRHGVTSAVKSKSMATEEIGLNHALEQAGVLAIETDLGEYIIQLAGTRPSHIIAPAVHLKKEEIAELFTRKLGVPVEADPVKLTAFARERLGEQFLTAGLGISGANFLVAESGTIVIVTNEGNGRMCTTVPDVHVAVVGIDKVVPDWESLGVLLKLLARSATGQKITTYTQFITGPRREEGEGGPKELHVVLLDNGRSGILRDTVARETLKCIRCGCCLNVCPVYKNVGGFAYGWFISGPIGAIFSPQILGTPAGRELPYASSLCGACVDVCPVKIPITKILLHLRTRVADGDATTPPTAPFPTRWAARLGRIALATGWIYRLGMRVMPVLEAPLTSRGWIRWLPPPLSRWTRVRPMPAFVGGFRSWWISRSRSRR